MKSLDSLPQKTLFTNTHGNPLTEARIRHYFLDRAVETGAVQPFTPKCLSCGGETLKKIEKHRTFYVCKECGKRSWASDVRVPTGLRYGVNPHEIRDLMRSRWQVSGVDPVVCEFMMGHDIDPNNYNKFTKYEPWYPIQEYRKFLPWANILSCDPAKVDRTEITSKLEEERELWRKEIKDLKDRQRRLERLLLERRETVEV